MTKTIKLIVFLFSVCVAANGQVVPEATGPGGLPVAGNLDYSVRYSQTASFGSTLGNYQSANASASLDYSNAKARLPFSLAYTGGYSWNIEGPSYGSGLFQNISLSQGITGRKWNVALTDNISFRAQAPTTGFSGITGAGDPIGTPTSGPPTDQSILNVNTEAINNNAGGQFTRTINSAISLNAGATSSLLRYPDGNAIDTDAFMANGGLSWRINGRNSMTGSFAYSDFSYPGSNTGFTTVTALVGFSRQWSRRLVTTGNVGPEWIQSSNTSVQYSDIPVVPSSTRISATASITYQMRSGAAGLNYSHGTSGGAGYLIGAESDILSGNYSRDFHKKLTLGFTTSYLRTSGLSSNGVTEAVYGSAQASRQFGRYLSFFANYTAIDQSTSSQLPGNAFTGLQQVIGFGIGYTPRKIELKH